MSIHPARAAGSALRAAVLSLAAAALLSCATSEPVELVPHVEVSPQAADLVPPGGGKGVSIGLEAEANESDSLERLERLPGVRVRTVEPTGPAAAAGLRPGDILLSAGGAPTDDPDALAAVLAGASDGSPIRLAVRRGTVAFEAVAVARGRSAGPPPRELYRADPVRIRAGLRTVTTIAASTSVLMAAEIIEIFPRSPLPEAGLRKGDRILALDGRAVTSAHDMVRRLLEEHEPGDDVELEVRRGPEVFAADVRLWEPPRRLTKLAALPLFRWASDAKREKAEFSLIDLWLFSVFSYRRDEGEKEYRIFSLIRFGSGRGELAEEPPRAEEER